MHLNRCSILLVSSYIIACVDHFQWLFQVNLVVLRMFL